MGKHRKQFPSYNQMCNLVYSDMIQGKFIFIPWIPLPLINIMCCWDIQIRQQWVERMMTGESLWVVLFGVCYGILRLCYVLCCYIGCYIIFMQLLTQSGWMLWLRVLKNYYIIVLISLGIWPENVVDEFQLLEEYRRFREMLQKVERDSNRRAERLSTMRESGLLANSRDNHFREDGQEYTLNAATVVEHSECSADLTDGQEKDRNDDDDDDDDTEQDEEDNDEDELSSEVDEELAATTATNTLRNTVTMRSSQHKRPMSSRLRPFSSKSSLSSPSFFHNHVDVHARLENDDRMMLLEYMSSLVSIRVVLLLILPGGAAWSVFASDISTCPVGILSSPLAEKLPPLICWTAWSDAQQMLADDAMQLQLVAQRQSNPYLTPTNSAPPQQPIEIPVWKRFSLAGHILLNRSRFIQFAITVVSQMTALTLVFQSTSQQTIQQYFHRIVFVHILLQLYKGCTTGLYLLLLLHKLIFPAISDLGEQLAGDTPTVFNQMMEEAGTVGSVPSNQIGVEMIQIRDDIQKNVGVSIGTISTQSIVDNMEENIAANVSLKLIQKIEQVLGDEEEDGYDNQNDLQDLRMQKGPIVNNDNDRILSSAPPTLSSQQVATHDKEGQNEAYPAVVVVGEEDDEEITWDGQLSKNIKTLSSVNRKASLTLFESNPLQLESRESLSSQSNRLSATYPPTQPVVSVTVSAAEGDHRRQLAHRSLSQFNARGRGSVRLALMAKNQRNINMTAGDVDI
jgi:hypothetical protein